MTGWKKEYELDAGVTVEATVKEARIGKQLVRLEYDRDIAEEVDAAYDDDEFKDLERELYDIDIPLAEGLEEGTILRILDHKTEFFPADDSDEKAIKLVEGLVEQIDSYVQEEA